MMGSLKTENYQLVRLKNGTCSIRSLAEDETFHPVIGPVAEAEALYVKQLRLRQRLRSHEGEFVVWDVGLGAAANAMAVLRATSDLPCSLRIISFDRTLEPLDLPCGTQPSWDIWPATRARLRNSCSPAARWTGGGNCVWAISPHGCESSAARTCSARHFI
jgi:hypothetical protein